MKLESYWLDTAPQFGGAVEGPVDGRIVWTHSRVIALPRLIADVNEIVTYRDYAAFVGDRAMTGHDHIDI